jgi:hypothetical protein
MAAPLNPIHSTGPPPGTLLGMRFYSETLFACGALAAASPPKPLMPTTSSPLAPPPPTLIFMINRIWWGAVVRATVAGPATAPKAFTSKPKRSGRTSYAESTLEKSRAHEHAKLAVPLPDGTN